MSESASPPLQHLGLIMDGNRRWAKQQGVASLDGHKAGYRALKQLLNTIQDLNIPYVSVYAYSTENWQRSKAEVQGLMTLLQWVLDSEINELDDNGICLRILGSDQQLPSAIVKKMRQAESQTRNNTKGTLALCFNYGGQQEIVAAARAVVASGTEITESSLAAALYAPDIPAIDLLIRTSGEQRLSNFMLWRAAYSELMFTETLWPDFSGDELRSMVEQYTQRQRRFGQ